MPGLEQMDRIERIVASVCDIAMAIYLLNDAGKLLERVPAARIVEYLSHPVSLDIANDFNTLPGQQSSADSRNIMSSPI